MAYNDIQSMIDYYGADVIREITDRDDTGAIDEGVLNRAIDNAAALIDSYIGAAVTLPLASVPQVLTMHANALTRYILAGETSIEKVQADYKAAIAWLMRVADGKVTLGLATASEPGKTSRRVSVAEGASGFDWESY